jgi:hypothetical protein
MATITEILDDLRAADEIIRRYERQYGLSSADFYERYSQGRLDDGENLEDFTEWAAFSKLKLRREEAFARLPHQRRDTQRHVATPCSWVVMKPAVAEADNGRD